VADFLLELVRDAMTSLALVVGAQTLAGTLVLMGATTLAVAAMLLVSRGASAVALTSTPVQSSRMRQTREIGPLVPQRDPDAPGRVRPRAPGSFLG
jgi:hypothetical protein